MIGTAQRMRAGPPRKPRALCRLFMSGLALTTVWGRAPAAAQFEPEPDDVVLEQTTSSFPPSPPSYDGTAKRGGDQAWSNTAALYEQPPDPARCVAGILRPETKYRFLDAFNALRARHGLAPVRYNEAADQAAAEAALMMATNNALSHDPPPTWSCWTAAGTGAAGSSNLLGGVSSPYLAYEDDNAVLAEWLIEGEGDEIGHRRWLLDPYLEETTLGRVIAVQPSGVRLDSVVMKVFDFQPVTSHGGGLGLIPDFVAWPQGDYPAVFFSPRARFSFSISQAPEAMPSVDFSDARVSISDGARNLPVRDRLWDNEGFGVANCLSWRVDGIAPGRTYTVTITGVRDARSLHLHFSNSQLEFSFFSVACAERAQFKIGRYNYFTLGI